MEKQWVLDFLRQHQPMPPDNEASDDLFDDYEDVLDYIAEHPDQEFVPLLLGSFGKGEACGLYACASRIAFNVVQYEQIAPNVLDALQSYHPGVRFWTACGVVSELDDPTIEDLMSQVPGLRKTLGNIVWEYNDGDEDVTTEEEDHYGGIDYLRWSKNVEVGSKAGLQNLSGALVAMEHIPIHLRDAHLSDNGDLTLPTEIIEGECAFSVGNSECGEGNRGLKVHRMRQATIKIANVVSCEVCGKSEPSDGTVCLDNIGLRRNVVTIEDDCGYPALRATVSAPSVSLLVSDEPAGELYIFNNGSTQHLITDRESAKAMASELGLEVDWISLWTS